LDFTSLDLGRRPIWVTVFYLAGRYYDSVRQEGPAGFVHPIKMSGRANAARHSGKARRRAATALAAGMFRKANGPGRAPHRAGFRLPEWLKKNGLSSGKLGAVELVTFAHVDCSIDMPK
jgi:hypothetical protein